MIFGKHTLAETRNLLALVDYRFRQTAKAFEEMKAKGLPYDIDIRSDLVDDWNILWNKWIKDRKKIVLDLALIASVNPFISSDILPTEDEWIKLLNYVQFQENVKGSLQDIGNRIERAGETPIDLSKPPHEVVRDVDMDLFKELDAKIKAGEQAAAKAKQSAKEAATSNTALIVGGTVLGTLATIAAIKIYL